MRERALIIAVAMMLATTGVAQGWYVSGVDSVIGPASAREIPYRGDVPWEDVIPAARDAWNDLNTSSNVDIHWADDDQTATLKFKAEEVDASWYGYFDYVSNGTDWITLNSLYLDGETAFVRKTVAAHELGHALGLAHNPDETQLMHRCSACQDGSLVRVPQTKDINHYYYLWP